MSNHSPDRLHPDWLDAIFQPATYPHAVAEIRLIETHISWVVLTGQWVYKLKKPVNFGFVDFSTLALRHAACLEEVRLNQRTAAAIYDGIVELNQTAAGPRFGSQGPVLEYAVRMHQFPQEDLLDEVLQRHELTSAHIDGLAIEIAELHRQAAVCDQNASYGTPESVRDAVQACLDALAQAELPEPLRDRLNSLQTWVNRESERLRNSFVQRKQQGSVRECHGDLHLGNLVMHQGTPTPFDCLEFNAQLRWIDMISDIAFVVMDLHDRDASQFAWRLLNGWLQQTGDYDGLRVFKYYLVYRALVRAKVAAIRLNQAGLPTDQMKHQHELLDSYVDLAARFAQPINPSIVLMHGVSGSGKSYVARHLAMSLGAIQIRSDIERKRLSGLWPSANQGHNSANAIKSSEIYSTDSNQKTYQRLQDLVKTIIAAGFPVIVDAAFLRATDRQVFMALADQLAVPWRIVTCNAPSDVLLSRIEQRTQAGSDPSDATAEVLQRQCAHNEPLQASESHSTIHVDTSRDDLTTVVQRLREPLMDARYAS